MTGEDCTFCRLGSGEIPADKLFDDGTVFAIRDINPRTPVHVLVIPHAHVDKLTSSTAQQLAAAAHCLEVAPGIARDQGMSESGYRLVANQGLDSGQEIPHFHLHVLGGRRLGAMA